MNMPLSLEYHSDVLGSGRMRRRTPGLWERGGDSGETQMVSSIRDTWIFCLPDALLGWGKSVEQAKRQSRGRSRERISFKLKVQQ